MQEALGTDYTTANIRLREGEYQYSLAKAIASFQLDQYFPDVKDIINRLWGEEKTSDIQFIRKIQTILKKMERNNIVRILPKKKPWDLQRYALLSFKFQDVDKNLVILATDQEIKQAQDTLRSMLIQQRISTAKLVGVKIKICMLMLIVGGFYATSVWAIMQPIINIFIFVPAISVAVASSIMLGKLLSRE
jgi:hypothetical protein